ncbi:MAG TPA: SRPBCC family protein [Leptospiraceae bacterium]|nr:SRPBCC family protein [Leptospiraceae bacterium]HMW04496.1 SRPBCC family protein [Leptospiraceae bacterium]HMX31154.1 SRPBCC family protein [Leptospiraceae bacterium]HMY30682.1 SRPBCC family protein [Leptospiraceae bacterium]HMZ63249.1 SRPBCC family protein [Leptospiraceae bacterium]
MAKKIVFVLLGLVALILIIPAMMKSTFKVERSIEIARPAEVIFPQISDFNRMKEWSIWAKNDPNQKYVVTGNPGAVGHKQEWDGKINGKGTQEITAIETNKYITTKLTFLEPNKMESVAKQVLEPTANGTKVIWSNEGNLDYPMGRLFGPFIDGMVGPDFEKGLSNLKQLVEK